MGINLAVYGNGGGNGAGAYAAQGVDGEKTVFGGFAGLDSKLYAEFVDDLLGALYIAGGAEAAADDVFSAWFKSEEGIEGNNAVDFRNGNSGALGNNLLHLQGYVAVFLLNVAQNYNERGLFRNIAVAYFVNLCNRGFA